jgi:ATP-dependent protease Clp ATPase subunit
MLEVMYDLPAMSEVKKCIVTEGAILKGERPAMLLADGTPAPAAQVARMASQKAESA